jgi:hypothetical protein
MCIPVTYMTYIASTNSELYLFEWDHELPSQLSEQLPKKPETPHLRLRRLAGQKWPGAKRGCRFSKPLERRALSKSAILEARKPIP